MDYLTTILLSLVGMLLWIIILLQRGRGGGLAGAFGGLGGQSAFGTKAGDVFTKITIVLAVVWVALAGFSIWALEAGSDIRYSNPLGETSIEAKDGKDKAADKTDAGNATDTGKPADADKNADAEKTEAKPADDKQAPDTSDDNSADKSEAKPADANKPEGG